MLTSLRSDLKKLLAFLLHILCPHSFGSVSGGKVATPSLWDYAMNNVRLLLACHIGRIRECTDELQVGISQSQLWNNFSTLLQSSSK